MKRKLIYKEQDTTYKKFCSLMQQMEYKITCTKIDCDHKTFKEDPKIPILYSKGKVNSLLDLICLGNTFHCQKNTNYCDIDLSILNEMIPALQELNNMIGMKNVKESIIDQILFFLKGYDKKKCQKCNNCLNKLPCVNLNDNMLHTVISGPPGTGKTNVAQILGKIYKAMKILSNGKFHYISRTDLVGKYLGHTAVKTQKAIEKCKGGIMFIDEAYSLGHAEKRDSFSKECIDVLNKNLSECRDLVCIIAGYKQDLEECFFSQNTGLKRRFPFHYDIENYSSKELLEIFLLKVKNDNWNVKIDKPVLENFFTQNSKYFKNFGGDIELFFFKCKIIRCRILNKESDRNLIIDDLNKAILYFKTPESNNLNSHMYL